MHALVYVGAIFALFLAIASWMSFSSPVKSGTNSVSYKGMSFLPSHPYLSAASIVIVLAAIFSSVFGTKNLPSAVRSLNGVRNLVPPVVAGFSSSAVGSKNSSSYASRQSSSDDSSGASGGSGLTSAQVLNARAGESLKEIRDAGTQQAQTAGQLPGVLTAYFTELDKYARAHNKQSSGSSWAR